MTELSKWVGNTYIELVIDYEGSFIRSTTDGITNILFEGSEKETTNKYNILYS